MARKRTANVAAAVRRAAKRRQQREAAKQRRLDSRTATRPPPRRSAPPAEARRPVDPFLTPEQQQALNEYLAGLDRELLDLGFNYAQQAANTVRDAGDIVGGEWRDVVAPDGTTYREYLGGGQLSNSGTLWARGAAQQQYNENALAARGLSQSSIRDTDLSDIQTATTLARTNMLSNLAQLAAYNERVRGQIASSKHDAQTNYNTLAVQNAQAVPPTPEPDSPGAPAAPAAPAAPRARRVAAPRARRVAAPTVARPGLNLRRQNVRAANRAASLASSYAARHARQQARSLVPGARRPKTVRPGRPFHGGAGARG